MSNRNRWSFHERPGPPPLTTAAVPETGPGGQREEHSGGPMMFRERNELSIMGPTRLSRGNTRGAV